MDNFLKLILLIALLLLVAQVARAADVGCGRDTDRSGTVDNACPGNDKDNDGYTSGDGDCIDDPSTYAGAWQIYPGAPTNYGCSAGQWRTCKADGTGWTSCTSAAYCPQGDYTTHTGKAATNCYYIDPVSGDNSNDGSYANPWQSLRKVSYHYSGKEPGGYSLHSPSAGDAYIMMAGTHTEIWDNTGWEAQTFFGCRDTNGTSANPIWVIADPAAATQPKLDPAFTKTSSRITMKLSGCDYWIFDGLEITDGYGNVFKTEDNATGSANNWFTRNYIHDNDLYNCSSDNEAVLHAKVGPVNHYFKHNHLKDNYASAAPTHSNCYNVVFFNGTGNEINYNVITNSNNTYGGGIKQKHATCSDDFTANNNYVFSVGNYAFEAGGPVDFKYNLTYDVENPVKIGDIGGDNCNQNVSIQYNTFVNSNGAVNISPDETEDANGDPAADACSGTADIDAINYSYNIIETDVSGQTVLSFHTYGPKHIYDELFTNAAWSSDYNCFYTTTGDITIDVMSSNNADETCSGRASGTSYSGSSVFTDWQTFGYDANSYYLDPQLAATYIPAAAQCEDFGYMGQAVATPDNPPFVSATKGSSRNYNSGKHIHRRFY